MCTQYLHKQLWLSDKWHTIHTFAIHHLPLIRIQNVVRWQQLCKLYECKLFLKPLTIKCLLLQHYLLNWKSPSPPHFMVLQFDLQTSRYYVSLALHMWLHKSAHFRVFNYMSNTIHFTSRLKTICEDFLGCCIQCLPVRIDGIFSGATFGHHLQ